MAELNRIRFCGRAGCMTLVTNVRFCPVHVAAERAARPANDRFYKTAAWAHVRVYKLHRFPMCEFVGCDKPATDVHHRDDSWKQRGDWRAFIDQSGLEALCHQHHSAITMTRNNERILR